MWKLPLQNFWEAPRNSFDCVRSESLDLKSTLAEVQEAPKGWWICVVSEQYICKKRTDKPNASLRGRSSHRIVSNLNWTSVLLQLSPYQHHAAGKIAISLLHWWCLNHPPTPPAKSRDATRCIHEHIQSAVSNVQTSVRLNPMHSVQVSRHTILNRLRSREWAEKSRSDQEQTALL